MLTYGESFYDSVSLGYYARRYLRALPKEVHKLLSQGTSGCAIASAMLSISKRKLMHTCVRKEGERAHLPYNIQAYDGCYAIVDDLVDTGNTIHRLLAFTDLHGLRVRYVIVGLITSEYIPCLEKDLKERNIRLIQIEPIWHGRKKKSNRNENSSLNS
jgi:orotate phosphoribosyltransferase